MEHTYDIQFIQTLNPIYKKKVALKTENPSVYTIISADFSFASDPPCTNDEATNNTSPQYDDYYSPVNLFRSVILNENETRLLSFSLPKSVSFDEFKERYTEVGVPLNLESSRFLINEIIEGTMINLWWDDENNHWQISTKKSISGNYNYFKNPLVEKQKTFKQMFMEVIGDFETPEFDQTANLKKDCYYSFVIKHPENHIVHSVFQPAIYLVAVYEKIDDWKVKYIPQNQFMKWGILPDINIQYPRILNFQPDATIPSIVSYSHIFAYIECENQKNTKAIINRIPQMENENKTEVNTLNYMVGVMITDTKTGVRTKIENSVYKYLKELRGNHPSYKYKYYELVLKNRLSEFIYYFPQYYDLFMSFEKEFHTFAETIHWFYVNKYILKNPLVTLMKDIPYSINYHINHLHYNVYLPFIKIGQKKKITLNLIYSYIWEMPIKTILFWLKYDSIMAKKSRVSPCQPDEMDQPVEIHQPVSMDQPDEMTQSHHSLRTVIHSSS
jgi:hypothetical protein